MQKNIQTIKRLWNLLSDFHKDFYIQLTFIIFGQLITVYNVYLSAQILNNLINKNLQQIYILLAQMIILIITKVLINYFAEIHGSKQLDFKIQQFLEEYSFKKIFKLNIFQYTEDHSAIKNDVINRGENSAERIISTLVLNVIPTSTLMIFSLGAIAIYSKTIALIGIVTLFIVTIPIKAIVLE
jgi:ABC-type multidrug transport system fused ATPase/permease subunit